MTVCCKHNSACSTIALVTHNIYLKTQSIVSRIGRNEGDRRMWQNDVHPSRAMDVNPESSAMEENSARRTDRFVTERFKRSNAGRSFQRGGTEGRRGGRRWERRSEGDGRGWRGDEERGRGERGGGEREDGGQGVTGEMEEGVEGEVGEQRSQFEGRRGRGRWRVAKEREEMEREEQVFREKRLMDSLTDPRDVPKGSWYFEVKKNSTLCKCVFCLPYFSSKIVALANYCNSSIPLHYRSHCVFAKHYHTVLSITSHLILYSLA